MWREMTISPANLDDYEALCLRLGEGQKIFDCGHRLALHQDKDEWEASVNLSKSNRSDANKDKTEICQEGKEKQTENFPNKKDKNENAKLDVEVDIGALQREVIHILHSSGATDMELSKTLGYKEVCEGVGDAIEEEVLLRACSKAEKRDGTVVALVGKLLLLPKIYHLDTSLSTPITDAVTHLMETHTSVIVENVIHPLLLHLPNIHQQHRDLLAHLLPACPPHLATRLLRAFSERPHQTEADADLSTFHLLLEAADPKDPDTHTAAVTVITHTTHVHHSNVRFGQCLSVALRRFGPHMNDLEGLQFAVNTHKSSLRKLLESQLKRLSKKQ